MPHVFTAITPLGDQAKFARMEGTEEISRPFDVTLTLASEDKAIPSKSLLGKSLSVEVELQDRSKRYFTGIAVEVRQIKRHGRNHMYEARLRPAFWLLTQTSDFRIFQKLSARDIVRQMLQEFNIVFKDKLNGYYPVLDYTVCYGESYFDFLSRVMEAAGIAYYIEHTPGSHTLVLCDSLSAYPVLPASHATIPYYAEDMAAIPDEEFVSSWHVGEMLNPGRVVMRDYNYKGPKAYLDVTQPYPRDHENSNFEKYMYPGVYRTLEDGENFARINMESLQNEHERADAETNVRGIMPGYRFTLSRCPRADQNREYRIVSATYHWVSNSYEGGRSAEILIHDTSFNAQPTTETFRPARITPYPVAHATDLAIVAGPPGQEIWVNEHGCIKVWFPWDRYSSKDQDSSCWVRVSQPWAGSNYGMMHVPRIGTTVVIGYVNNNPDFPIVISRVYDADHMPPWDLPANATQSGILTRSTKDGGYGNANALRFEDKKGSEELWIHAEKDQLTEVENNEKKWVGNDREKTIDRDETTHVKRDRTETVDRNEDITVHGKRTEVVDGNENITIHANRTERVDQSEKISIGDTQKLTVGSTRTKNIGGNENNTINRNQSISVGMNKTETVKFMAMENVGIAKVESIGAGYMLNVGAAWMSTVGFLHQHNVGMSYKINVGKTMSTTVGTKLNIKVGSGGGSSAGPNAGQMNIVAPSGGEKKDDGGSEIIMDAESITLKVGKCSFVMKKDGTATWKADEHIQLDSKRVDLN